MFTQAIVVVSILAIYGTATSVPDRTTPARPRPPCTRYSPPPAPVPRAAIYTFYLRPLSRNHKLKAGPTITAAGPNKHALRGSRGKHPANPQPSYAAPPRRTTARGTQQSRPHAAAHTRPGRRVVGGSCAMVHARRDRAAQASQPRAGEGVCGRQRAHVSLSIERLGR